ncbi:oligosaccharide flippase family protein [Exiguobacterium sp. E4787]|uniref:oligosaccharide flippase family protein n=1 Tax=Exiguobacterium sp. E4787 TaxID=2751225 RepID=UPI001BE5518F|nr:oligosaccharide flippase family protein [Exiguobacterium sp. E4787]
MNNKAVIFLKNIWYSISSNLITLAISTVTILIFPKLLGVNDYGLLQLYLFYCAYVGFFHLGLNDGIYLRYGGKHYEELNKKVFNEQYYLLLITQLLFFIVLWLFALLFVQDSDKTFVVKMVSISMVLVNLRVMLVYVLQATNEIKKYALVMLSDRVSFLFGVTLLLVFDNGLYKEIIIIDLVAKLISLLVSIYYCKEIVFKQSSLRWSAFEEAKKNISVGIKLMIANFSNILIVGNVRFGIEKIWDVSTFGKISLTLSISNLLLVFINAVGIVIFPVLKRVPKNELPQLYLTLRTLLSTSLLGSMFLFYPLSFLLLLWLPEYKLSIIYMGLLFPIVLFEGKMALLINTYLKAIRKEKIILSVNLLLVLLSFITTAIIVYNVQNLTLSILSIVILLGLRSLLSEYLLTKILGIQFLKNAFPEIIMIAFFITLNSIASSNVSFLLYFGLYSLYLFLYKNEISKSVRYLTKIIKTKN